MPTNNPLAQDAAWRLEMRRVSKMLARTEGRSVRSLEDVLKARIAEAQGSHPHPMIVGRHAEAAEAAESREAQGELPLGAIEGFNAAAALMNHDLEGAAGEMLVSLGHAARKGSDDNLATCIRRAGEELADAIRYRFPVEDPDG